MLTKVRSSYLWEKIPKKNNFTLIILVTLILVSIKANGQTFHISGNVSTSTTPVRYASVTFINESDTTKKSSAIADVSGNYQLDIITSIKEEPVIPQSIELLQNYPNPFLSETKIPYKLMRQSDVSIKIYDILGQEVKTFIIGFQLNGIHEVRWDGRNNFGNRVPSGIYFYQLQVGNETLVKKMILGLSMNGNSLFSQQFFSPSVSIINQKTEQNQKTKFTIRIENTENTTPRILIKEFKSIILQSDTTINFIAETGKIIFVKLDTIFYNNQYLYKTNIYKINIDGTGIEQLKNGNEIIETPGGSEPRGSASKPRWSREGKKIVYAESQGPDESHIVIMDEDGLNRKNLTPVGAYGILPKWRPQGDRILYLRGEYLGGIVAVSSVDTMGNSIDIIDISNEFRVFNGDSVFLDLTNVQWYPDGEQIYILGSVDKRPISYICGENLIAEIFQLHISTGNIIQRLTYNEIDECGFEVNPEGTHFLWGNRLVSFEDNSFETIPAISGYFPHWSNDRRFIVGSTYPNEWHQPEDAYNIYLVNLEEPDRQIKISSLVITIVTPDPDIYIE